MFGSYVAPFVTYEDKNENYEDAAEAIGNLIDSFQSTDIYLDPVNNLHFTKTALRTKAGRVELMHDCVDQFKDLYKLYDLLCSAAVIAKNNLESESGDDADAAKERLNKHCKDTLDSYVDFFTALSDALEEIDNCDSN